jgi:hypothetical protein
MAAVHLGPGLPESASPELLSAKRADMSADVYAGTGAIVAIGDITDERRVGRVFCIGSGAQSPWLH